MAMRRDEVLHSSLSVLDRICTTAAEICDSETALIAYNRDGRTRILASHGLDKRFRIYPFELKNAPFKPRQCVIVSRAEQDPFYSKMGSALGMPVCSLFIRVPISITRKHATSLIVLSGRPGAKPPPPSRLDVLRDAAVLARDQLSSFFPLLDDDSQRVSVLTTAQSMFDNVTAAKVMAAIVDEQLCVRAISKPLLRIMGRKPDAVIGRTVTELGLHSGNALAFLFRQALEGGVSLPEFEVVRPGAAGVKEVIAVHATPLSPTDTPKSFLYVSARDVTSLTHREALINRRIKASVGKYENVEEPSLRFLLDTLVPRRVLRERNGVGYFTIESWRQSICTYQIAALKALKCKVPPEMSHVAATRLAEEIGRFRRRGRLQLHCSRALQQQRPGQLPFTGNCAVSWLHHGTSRRAMPQPPFWQRCFSPQEECPPPAYGTSGADSGSRSSGG